MQPGLARSIAAELDRCESDWPRGLPQGVIHADLFPDNVFFLGDRLSGLIDFYFACTDTLAYDVAICLNAWCFEPDVRFNVTKAPRAARRLWRGAAAVGGRMEALPLLARGAALRFLLTRLVDWLNVPPGALVRPKDPLEYAQAALPPGRRERARLWRLTRGGEAARPHGDRSHRRRLLAAIPGPAAGARS